MTSTTWLATITDSSHPGCACLRHAGRRFIGAGATVPVVAGKPGHPARDEGAQADREWRHRAGAGYMVEYAASTIKVFGPYPTGSGASGLKIFGVDVRRLGTQAGEDLGLISQKLSGIAVGGCDCGAGGTTSGFDNLPYRTGNKTITKLDVALFEFSEPIKVNSVKVDQVSNFGRQIWVAACSTAPSFANGLKAAIAACTVRNKNDTPGGATFTHQIGLSGVRYLVVGARPDSTRPNANSLAPITAGSKNGTFTSRRSTSPSDAGAKDAASRERAPAGRTRGVTWYRSPERPAQPAPASVPTAPCPARGAAPAPGAAPWPDFGDAPTSLIAGLLGRGGLSVGRRDRVSRRSTCGPHRPAWRPGRSAARIGSGVYRPLTLSLSTAGSGARVMRDPRQSLAKPAGAPSIAQALRRGPMRTSRHRMVPCS